MRTRTTLILTLCGGTALALGAMPGCEDGTARQRAEFQQTIQAASQEFRMAAAARPHPDDANADRVRAELRSIVGRLSPAAEIEPGQQAAAHLLAAQALHELASIDIISIDHREQKHRLWRQEMARNLASGMRLAALADGHAAVTTAEQRSSLQRERQRLEADLNDLAARVRELDGPIDEHSQHNTSEAERVRALRAEANDLLRRALELGHERGFPDFEDSVDVRRQADRIEHGIAQREIELDRELNPEHALANARHEHLRAMMEAMHAAMNDLTAYEELYGERAGDLRADVAQRRDAILQMMRRLHKSAQELDGLYEQTIGHLERAVNSARQASSRLQPHDREAAAAARLAEARSHEALGNASWARVRGLDDQIELLSRLIESENVLGNVQPLRAELETQSAARQEASERARAAYEAAQKILEQLPAGRAPEAVNAYKTNLRAALAALSGETVDWTAIRASQSVGEFDDEFSPPTGGRGFASVEEAVAALRAAEADDMHAVRQLIGAMHATSPAARAMVSLFSGLIEAAYDLERAMMDQFGVADIGEAFGAMASMAAPQVSGVRIAAQSDDRATLIISDGVGDEEPMELVKINGRWLIDADAEFDDGPEAAMMMAMMEPMFRTMIDSIRGLAAQVRAGQFASADQVALALMQLGSAEGMEDFEWPEGMELPEGFDWPGGK